MIIRLLLAACALFAVTPAFAGPFGTPDRNGGLVSIEPYGPSIVHVTIALDPAQIDAPAGYSVSGKPDVTSDSTKTWVR